MSRHVRLTRNFIERLGSDPFKIVQPKNRRNLLKTILGKIAVNSCVDNSNELYPLAATANGGLRSVAFRRWKVDYYCDSASQIVHVENITYVPKFERDRFIEGGASDKIVDRGKNRSVQQS